MFLEDRLALNGAVFFADYTDQQVTVTAGADSDGDGTNDYFELESEGLSDFSVVVFNPSGDIVFQSNDPAFRWDGRDIRSGEMVDSGTYMYMVSAYDSEGNPFPIYERLTIKR